MLELACRLVLQRRDEEFNGTVLALAQCEAQDEAEEYTEDAEGYDGQAELGGAGLVDAVGPDVARGPGVEDWFGGVFAGFRGGGSGGDVGSIVGYDTHRLRKYIQMQPLKCLQ